MSEETFTAELEAFNTYEPEAMTPGDVVTVETDDRPYRDVTLVEWLPSGVIVEHHHRHKTNAFNQVFVPYQRIREIVKEELR